MNVIQAASASCKLNAPYSSMRPRTVSHLQRPYILVAKRPQSKHILPCIVHYVPAMPTLSTSMRLFHLCERESVRPRAWLRGSYPTSCRRPSPRTCGKKGFLRGAESAFGFAGECFVGELTSVVPILPARVGRHCLRHVALYVLRKGDDGSYERGTSNGKPGIVATNC